MKTLKFTPENLRRHLRFSPYVITTARDEQKVSLEDLIWVDGCKWEVTDISAVPTVYRDLINRHCVRGCGFGNPEEFWAEIERCYGEIPKTLWFIELTRITPQSEMNEK